MPCSLCGVTHPSGACASCSGNQVLEFAEPLFSAPGVELAINGQSSPLVEITAPSSSGNYPVTARVRVTDPSGVPKANVDVTLRVNWSNPDNPDGGNADIAFPRTDAQGYSQMSTPAIPVGLTWGFKAAEPRLETGWSNYIKVFMSPPAPAEPTAPVSYTYTLPDGRVVTSTTELTLEQLKAQYPDSFQPTGSSTPPASTPVMAADSDFATVKYVNDADIGLAQAIVYANGRIGALERNYNQVVLPQLQGQSRAISDLDLAIENVGIVADEHTTRLNDPVKGIDAINKGLAAAYQTDLNLDRRISQLSTEVFNTQTALRDAGIIEFGGAGQIQQPEEQTDWWQSIQNALAGFATGGGIGVILLVVLAIVIFSSSRQGLTITR